MPTFSGQETINAAPDRVWAVMLDPRRFTACAPTMKNVRIKNEREFTFDVSVMGRAISFEAKCVQLDPPHFAHQKVSGGSMLTGGAKMDNELRISPSGTASTVDWKSTVELNGAAKMLVSEAQLRSMVNEMLQDVITCLKGQIEAG